MHGLPGLKQMRLRAGLTQEQLARLIGVHSISVSRYELGNQDARYKVITKLAVVLKCTEQELLFPQVEEVANVSVG